MLSQARVASDGSRQALGGLARWLVAVAAVAGCDAPAETTRSLETPATSTGTAGARVAPRGPSTAAQLRDSISGARFTAPKGLRLEAEHFAHSEPSQIRHALTLAGPRGPELAVDLWSNPARLPLARWFDRHLAFVRDGHAAVDWVPLTRHHVMGMLIERPRSPQAYGQRIALFALGARVIRVTCLDRDEAGALAAFEEVIRSFELEAQP